MMWAEARESLWLAVLLWASLAGLAYIYAGYPVAIAVLGRLFPRRVRRAASNRSVSVIISASNESARIARKLDNLLQSHHAERICEILVGSDGSTDDTVAVVERYPDRRVRCVAFPEQRGKPAVINALAAQAQGEILVMADVRQMFDAAAIDELDANFDDPTVGCVSGELVFRVTGDATTAAEGIGFYWTYEKWIRKAESRFRGVPGATGAIYAVRRSLFRPIPETTILDDVLIPMQAAALGGSIRFEPRAIAYDEPSKSTDQESIRKRRTIAGNAQLAGFRPLWLLPGVHPLWFEFWSHKLLRLVSPLLLTIAFATNVALSHQAIHFRLLIAQISFYTLAAIGWLAQRSGRRSKLFAPAMMFCSLNWTTALALWDAVRGEYRVTWKRTNLPSP